MVCVAASIGYAIAHRVVLLAEVAPRPLAGIPHVVASRHQGM